jgi:hypothetical protein
MRPELANSNQHLPRALFDIYCEQYDRQVRSLAIQKLLEHGYYGLEPRADAPNSYEAIVNVVKDCKFGERTPGWNRPKTFPVYNGGCDNTVFTNAVGNLSFRAWHDLLHYELDADLSYEGEHKVAVEQAKHFTGPLKDICLADTVAQLNFFAFTGGLFVENQRDFVYDCLTIGEPAAIVKHERLQRKVA